MEQRPFSSQTLSRNARQPTLRESMKFFAAYVKKEETKKTPTEPSLFAVSSSSYFNPGEVRENEEARLVRRFDARCYGGCAQTHSLQRVRPRRRLSRKCISLSFGKRRIKLFSCGLFS